MSRLLAECYPGQKTIKLEPGLGWMVNETIGLAANTMRYNDSDTAVIVSYDNKTGVTVLDRNLSAYHYGAAASTAPQYSGVDIRGEVYLLSRNVKISG